VSQNHDGYDSAMQDVLSILDAYDKLGSSDVSAIRIAVESLCTSNLRSAAEQGSGLGLHREAPGECCHGTKGCEGRGEKHWCGQ
jgi:hypothetical protein